MMEILPVFFLAVVTGALTHLFTIYYLLWHVFSDKQTRGDDSETFSLARCKTQFCEY